MTYKSVWRSELLLIVNDPEYVSLKAILDINIAYEYAFQARSEANKIIIKMISDDAGDE